MLKFFRRIRQNLLTENKTGKYLKYAIGEIILVVIGILIALQINNWNEQRKSNVFELKMLGEIYKSLSYDNYILKSILKDRIMVVDSSVNALLTMYEKDSIDMKKFNSHAINLQMGYIFSYSTGPYETLKIAGLDKVKNDTLRDKLIFHYDYEIPRRVNLIQPFSNPEIFEKTRVLEDQIFSYKIITNETGKTFEVDSFKLNNPRDKIFMDYLLLRTRATKKGISNFKNYIEDADKMIDLLLKEFDKRNYPKPEFILL